MFSSHFLISSWCMDCCNMLQDLCWVLEPERLCEAITGKKWSDVDGALEKSPDLMARFRKHRQLAE